MSEQKKQNALNAAHNALVKAQFTAGWPATMDMLAYWMAGNTNYANISLIKKLSNTLSDRLNEDHL